MTLKKLTSHAFILVICSLVTHNLHALTWEELNIQIYNSEMGKEVDWDVVSSLIDIVNSVTNQIKEIKKQDAEQMSFCPPENREFSLDEITGMIRAYARRTQAGANASVEKLLIETFESQFPCSS